VKAVRRKHQIDAGFVVGSEVNAGGVAGIDVLHSDLSGLQFDAVHERGVNDGFAKVIIGMKGLETEAAVELAGKIAQVGLQLDVRDFAGSKLPANENGERKSGKRKKPFEFAHEEPDSEMGKIILRSLTRGWSFFRPGVAWIAIHTGGE
jgi:hypothetical protein